MNYSMDDIDNFLLGELSKSEEAKFLNRMEEDQSLKNTVGERELELGMINHNSKLLRKRLQKIQPDQTSFAIDIHKKTTRQKISRWLNWAGAAIIIIGMAVGAFELYNEQNGAQGPELFAQEYAFYNSDLIKRSEAENPNINKIINYLESEKYNECIPLLEEMLDSSSNANLEILLANCYMQTNDFEAAKSNLLKAKSNALFEQEANWYLALLALKSDDMDEAKSLLLDLSENGSGNLKAKAKELLKAIQ